MQYKWAIVSDLVRALSNTSSSGLDFNDTETENALNDVATIMDAMMVNKCSFDKAVKIERDNDEYFAEWLSDDVLKIIKQ